jgi:hypothetical protein
MERISSSSPPVSASTNKAFGTMTERRGQGHLQAAYNQGIRFQNSTNVNGIRTDTSDDTFARSIGDSLGRKRFISDNLRARCPSPRQGRLHAAGQYFVPAVNSAVYPPVPHNWHRPHSNCWYQRGGYRPTSQTQSFTHSYNGMHRGSSTLNRPDVSTIDAPPTSFRTVDYSGRRSAMAGGPPHWVPRSVFREQNEAHPLESAPLDRVRIAPTQHTSHIVIPPNVIIPKETSPVSETNNSPTDSSSLDVRPSSGTDLSPPPKRSKIGDALDSRFDKLDLLCAATLDLGPLQENPSGCSCPKSKCIALYCDCFKAGRRCNPDTCSCHNCKNTVKESGADGARSKVSLSNG